MTPLPLRLPVLAAALSGAILLAYLPGLQAPPAPDDLAGILGNPRANHVDAALRGFIEPPPPAAPGIPLTSYAWRPLTELSFAVNHAITGPSLTGLRLGNLLIHLGACLLVFHLAARLGSPGLAPWAALAFAVHPMGVQAVTYVYQRSTSLLAFLEFLTLALYLRARTAPGFWRSPWGWGALTSGLVMMGAKEPAVTLPLTLAAVEWVLREPGGSWRSVLGRWLPFSVLPAIVALQVYRVGAMAAPAPEGGFLESGFHVNPTGFTPAEYFLLQLPIVLGYLRQSVLPFGLHLVHDQVLPLPGAGAWIPLLPTLLSGVALGALAAWILLGSRRHSLARIALALFLAPLALECSVFPIKDLAFHHRAYPGLLGAVLLAGWAMARRPLLGAAVLLALASGTRSENRVWADPDALLSRDVRHAFHREMPWAHYAGRVLNLGQAVRAARLFAQPMRMPWLDGAVTAGHAESLFESGRTEEARRAVARGLAAVPESTDLLWQAVRISERERDEAALDRLADRLARLATLPPPLAAWLVGRRRAQGRFDEAEGVLKRALEVFPGDPILRAILPSGPRSGSPASR